MTIEQRSFPKIRDIINDIIKIFQHKVAEKYVILSDIADDVFDLLAGDPGRFRQILMNLVGNAVKFTNEGSVRIKCRVVGCSIRGGQLCSDVRGYGNWLYSKRANGYFMRLPKPIKALHKYGGTGLGLSISKQLVEL